MLVGINESGKSNIIKAVSLLNKDVEISKNDIRDQGHDEEVITTAHVRFIFKVDDFLIKKIFDQVKKFVLCKSFSSIIIDISGMPLDIKRLCEYKNEVLYSANLIKQTKMMLNYQLPVAICKIHDGWKKIKSGSTFNVGTPDAPIDISQYKIVNTNDYKEIPDSFLEELTIPELNNFVGAHLIEVCSKYLPTAILWEYSEENLLPGKISYSNFIADPNICAPLKNMFSLAGYSQPGKVLQEAEGKTNGIKNILRKVSQNTTAHMQSVWPEWKKQNVILYQNGDFLEAGIEDEFNVYSLSRRSDGFKRFFTFLLMISAENKTENIYDNIILIDEPDIGLHPSGVQYLRDELNKIAENNQVLVSTHSIFMIDKVIIDRHLIVEKKKEITTFKKVEASNILDEEVIYKALGYSLYEILKPANIIFEGWRDKNIFSIFARSKPGKLIINKTTSAKMGLLHAMGVKDVGRVANVCENVTRKYIIITDSDGPAKERKKRFEGSGEWVCYDDIDKIKAVTTEDFVNNKVINSSIKHILKQNNEELSIVIPTSIERDKIKYIQDELIKNGREKEKVSNLLNLIKEHICENITAGDLSADYSSVCRYLVSKINA